MPVHPDMGGAFPRRAGLPPDSLSFVFFKGQTKAGTWVLSGTLILLHEGVDDEANHHPGKDDPDADNQDGSNPADRLSLPG